MISKVAELLDTTVHTTSYKSSIIPFMSWAIS